VFAEGADDEEQVADAQRQLVRVGIDRPDGFAIGEPHALAEPDRIHACPRARFDQLAASRGGAHFVVLDVRRPDERAAVSLPDRTGFDVVLVDDDFTRGVELGLTGATPETRFDGSMPTGS
jgi:hypothetical protein